MLANPTARAKGAPSGLSLIVAESFLDLGSLEGNKKQRDHHDPQPSIFPKIVVERLKPFSFTSQAAGLCFAC